MATLRDIKRRITSVTSTQQITSAMKMISAAKLNRAQIAARAAQPYSEKLRRMVTALAHGLTGEDHPLFEVREGGASLMILFTSDRGLCGGFNNNLARMVHAFFAPGDRAPEPELVIFGRTGNDFFKRRNWPIGRTILYAKDPERRAGIRAVIEEVIPRFYAGEVGRVFLAFNRFYNPIRQVPQVLPLIPVVPPEPEEGDPEAMVEERETLFEPSRTAILDVLLPSYLENQLLAAHLNTEAGEHGARMVAMDAATKNAGEMIASLTLQYNRVRQAAITRDLIEIINGAEALK